MAAAIEAASLRQTASQSRVFHMRRGNSRGTGKTIAEALRDFAARSRNTAAGLFQRDSPGRAAPDLMPGHLHAAAAASLENLTFWPVPARMSMHWPARAGDFPPLRGSLRMTTPELAKKSRLFDIKLLLTSC